MERLLFKNRYRIPSARLPYWDYTQSGHYFITIKTQHNLPYFGVIRNQIMGLSEIGSIAIDELLKIPMKRPYVGMDEWSVMPNHIHVILYIKPRPAVETPSEGVSTTMKRPNHWSPGTLGTIINHFKRSCTVRMRIIKPCFAWQSRYHDRIIRDDDELNAVRNYIRNNVVKHSTQPFTNVETPSEGVSTGVNTGC